MRPCDVCGRPPKWLQCGPYEENVAVLCGYHARQYLNCVRIPAVWLANYRRAQRWREQAEASEAQVTAAEEMG